MPRVGAFLPTYKPLSKSSATDLTRQSMVTAFVKSSMVFYLVINCRRGKLNIVCVYKLDNFLLVLSVFRNAINPKVGYTNILPHLLVYWRTLKKEIS